MTDDAKTSEPTEADITRRIEETRDANLLATQAIEWEIMASRAKAGDTLPQNPLLHRAIVKAELLLEMAPKEVTERDSADQAALDEAVLWEVENQQMGTQHGGRPTATEDPLLRRAIARAEAQGGTDG